ncbi:hypothetical protein F5Y18DRAFT_28652 [Xylariaceae sp. FL1019]|nr:hypothetical protein F5Y18DRAFT_28652 [Xylariaceae sp. FL1019]
MVLLQYKVDPADVKATINVNMSTSPTISLSDPTAELDLNLSLSIDSSTQEGKPITFMAEQTVFEVHDPEYGGMDIFSRGGFGRLRNPSDPSKSISLGLFRVNSRPKNDTLDLRERGHVFYTIPGDGSPITIIHRLSWNRIFKYEDKRTKADLVPGETFDIGMGKGYIGTLWWCWGDMETDLKDKKLHVWREGAYGSEKPGDDFVKDGNWMLGEAPKRLKWEDVTEGGRASFKVVE